MSQSFTDSFAREWKLALDPFLVTKVYDEVKWTHKVTQKNSEGKDETVDVTEGVLLTCWADNKFELAESLRRDMRLLVSTLWSLCDEQAITNGCKANADKNSREPYREFAIGLGGNVLLGAIEALEVAIINFSRPPAEIEALMQMKAKAAEVATILEQERMEVINQIDPQLQVKNFIASVSSSLASQESTRSAEESHSAS